MLQKCLCKIKFYAILVEKILTFGWLVFQDENKWVLKMKKIFFWKTNWLAPSCDFSQQLLLVYWLKNIISVSE